MLRSCQTARGRRQVNLLRCNGLAHGRRNRSRATTATVLTVLVLVCFQLSRVFLTVPLSWYECPMLKRSREMASLSSHHHHVGTEAAKTDVPLSPNDGCSLRCCKGEVDGLGIIPLQAFGLTVEVSHPRLPATWVTLSRQHDSVLESYLPPPFQPPRHLG
jgi:hypothetical protein